MADLSHDQPEWPDQFVGCLRCKGSRDIESDAAGAEASRDPGDVDRVFGNARIGWSIAIGTGARPCDHRAASLNDDGRYRSPFSVIAAVTCATVRGSVSKVAIRSAIPSL